MSQSPKPKHLPAKLLAVRQKLGLSQTGIMRRLNISCCYTRISEYERGRRTPNLIVLLKYARLGEIHVDDLIDDSVSLFEQGSAMSENNGFDTRRQRLHEAAVELTVAIAALDRVVSALLDVGEELKKILDDATTTDTG